MIRLFIALPLPHDVETRLGQLISHLQTHETNRAVKWVPARNIHLTLKFLGDTDEKSVDNISGAIDAVAASFAPVEAVIDQLGAFPNLRRPRVIWAGCSNGLKIVSEIAKQIDLALSKFSYEKEKRPFKSHLTLGRVRQGKSSDDLFAYLTTFNPGTIPIHLDRITLFKSTLTPQGAIYERLHEAMLQTERFEG